MWAKPKVNQYQLPHLRFKQVTGEMLQVGGDNSECALWKCS